MFSACKSEIYQQIDKTFEIISDFLSILLINTLKTNCFTNHKGQGMTVNQSLWVDH